MIPRPASFCESCNHWKGKCTYVSSDGYGCEKRIHQVIRDNEGRLLELRIGRTWYYGDFVENTHRIVLEGKRQIGYGACGVVFREGDGAVKATYQRGQRTIEGEVYAEFGGTEGISPGRQDGNEIRTPVYENVVSKYTIRKPQRPLFGPLIAVNYELVERALWSLSRAGLSYGDALQFGVDGSQRLLLLDFSATTRIDPADAAAANAERLADLERDFEVVRC